MTLYQRMRSGDEIDWKWLYCESCRMEWLVPDVDPDALPKYCCHCREPIDTSIQPDQVFDDMPSADDIPERYDVNIRAAQISRFEFDDGTSIRVQPVDELHTIGGIEYRVITIDLTFLIDELVVVTMNMSYDSFVGMFDFMEDFVSVTADLLGSGGQIVNNESLQRFNAYQYLTEQPSEEDQDEV